jgi:hypothetical protein
MLAGASDTAIFALQLRRQKLQRCCGYSFIDEANTAFLHFAHLPPENSRLRILEGPGHMIP